jgi:beta-glucosidase
MVRAVDVDDLLSRMDLDEKLAQLGCVWVTDLVRDDRFDRDAAQRHLAHGIGHITRIGASTGLLPDESAALMNEIQRFAVEETRLGIPVVVHEESTGGYCARGATVFPQAIGLASTWDEALVEEVADVIRRQLVAVGARHTLAPVLDIARDPRWGRVEETYGEDPYLVGRIGTAYVRGIQRSLRDGVIATGKHFLGYGVSEGGMNHAPVQLGPRELREVYAEPFAAAIRDGGLASTMNSYASVDGIPCAGDASILDGLLRDELGFDGVVVADYYSVALLMTHHAVAGDRGEAAALALAAGLDMELPALDCYGAPLKERVLAGVVPMSIVDRAVRRVLESKERLGLFDDPYVDAAAAPAVFDTSEQRALARRAAAASVVVLTNDGVLPLPDDVGRIAVIGPAADSARLLQGDYHYPAHAEIVYERSDVALLPTQGGAFQAGPHFTPHVTPLAALRERFGSERVVHVAGCTVTGDDIAGIPDAIDAARDADVAIVLVGGESGLQPHSTVGEARDATDLDLTGVQEALAGAVIATGTPTVVVLVSGRVHTVPALAETAAALVQAWLPGEEGGHGIVDVLTGAVEPSGRLPISMPRRVGQIPVYASPRAGGGRSMFHGAYTDSPTSPLFPLGHGLSYTTFERGELVVESAGTTDEPIVLAIDVTNTGTRAGVELVQLTVRDDVASVARHRFALCGFARVPLALGETSTVRFTVHPSRLAFYDPSMRFVIEPGAFTFRAGAREAGVVLDGEVVEHRQRDVIATEAIVSPPRRG